MYIGIRTVRFQASSGGLGMGRLQTRGDSGVPHTGSSAPRVDLPTGHEGLRNISSQMKIQVPSSNLLSKRPELTSTLHRLRMNVEGPGAKVSPSSSWVLGILMTV